MLACPSFFAVMTRYLIGMGNYARQDDGIGLRIVEHIIDNHLDASFTAFEAHNDGLSILAHFVDDTEMILIVDCALIDKEPGDYLFFDVDDVDSKKLTGGISTHEGDILKIVGMAQELGYPIPRVRVLAIQPASLEMEMKLSPTLESRLEEYVTVAISEVEKL